MHPRSRSWSTPRALVLGGCLLAAPWSAAAQTCDTAAAEALEHTAQADNQAGRHEAALAGFLQAHTLCTQPRALARAALTEAALGRWLEAHRHLHTAMAQTDPWIAANQAALALEAQRIATHVGSLRITGTGTAGEVVVDGVVVAPWPMTEALPMRTGVVTVTVRAEGFHPVTRTVSVLPGALSREDVTLVPVTARPAEPVPGPVVPTYVPVVVPVPTALRDTPPEAPGPSAAPYRIVAWTSLGLAVAGLGLGGVATALRATTLDDLSTAGCGPTAPDPGRCDSLADRADTLGPWMVTGFVAGGVFALTAAITFVLAPSPSPRSLQAWRCGGGPGALGVACTVAF